MAFEPLEFTKNWENPLDFPTYEPDEAQVRRDLQWLHEETKNGLNRLVAALKDPAVAAELGFVPGNGLKSENIRDAILETYEAVRSAAAGMVLDGTVSKEKLTGELLARIYGGKVWVSMDDPGPGQNPDSDFPVGQLWLRPRFTADNLAPESWEVTGGTMEAQGNDWIMENDGSLNTVTATQTLESIGQAGQTVHVLWKATQLHDHLVDLTLYLNGVEQDMMEGGGVFETQLDQTGSLELAVVGAWPFPEAGAQVRLSNLTVVNTQTVDESCGGCLPLGDWPTFLEAKAPFHQVVMPRAMWVQEQPGLWKQTEYEVLPVERGGTGLDGFTKGQMLYADSEQTLKALDPAAEDNSFLLCEGSVPKWKTGAEVIGILGQLRLMTGQYTGNGSARTVTLPLAPKLLYIYSLSGIDNQGYQEKAVSEQPALLADGAQAADIMSNGTNYCVAAVKLTGSTLTFSRMTGSTNLNAIYLNKSGVKYNWIALY